MTTVLVSMLQTLWGFSLDLIPLVFRLLGLGLLLLLIAAALAPFESLGWWAGWFGQPAEQESKLTPAEEISGKPDRQTLAEAEHYLVYLSGVGAISGDFLEPCEVELCNRLAARFPSTAVVKDVFPYAMNNRGLTGQRLFAWMWRRIKQLKLEGKHLLANLINVRNFFQVLVSADRRYGPIYNFGTAEVIRDGLLRQGYRVGSGKPITIIGYSGGGQVALGAAQYLQEMLLGTHGVPERVSIPSQLPFLSLKIISLGGMMTADPGLDNIEHLYHLYGTKDPVQKLAALFYPGRWPIIPHSPWNRAKAQGKITRIEVGPIGHYGSKGYLSVTSHLGNGQRFLDRSVDSIAQVLAQYTNGS